MKYIFLLLFLSISLYAQWTSDSSVNTQVSPFGMSPIVTDDGDEGAIVFFYNGTSTRAYVQRIDKNGYVRWNNGVPVRVGGFLKNQNPQAICSDGFGGAYLQYTETDKTNPPDTGRTLVFTNRIDSTGKLLWNGTIGIDLGFELFNGSQPWKFNDYDIPFYKIVSSRKNGYWYAWVDSTHPAGGNNKKLKIQRITSNGSKIFGEYGLFVTPDVPYDAANDIISDNKGGIYVATSFKIFHFDSIGIKLFSDSGTTIGRGIISLQLNKNLNKVVCLNTVDNVYKNCFMTVVDSIGKIQWDKMVLDSIDLFLDKPKVTIDKENNINLFWLKRFSTNDFGILYSKIDTNGNILSDLLKSAVIEDTTIFRFEVKNGNSNSNVIIWSYNQGDGLSSCLFKVLIVDSAGNKRWEKPIGINIKETSVQSIRSVDDFNNNIIIVWYEVGTRNGIYAQQISRDGKLGQVTTVDYKNASIIPSKNYLEENYPNPFNPSTLITYQISSSSDVTVDVYDMLGRKITNLVHQQQEAGNYSIVFNAQSLPSGIYICRLTVGNYSKSIKMVLLK